MIQNKEKLENELGESTKSPDKEGQNMNFIAPSFPMHGSFSGISPAFPAGVPLKKKRGRKPKNYLLLKAREQEDAAIMQARLNSEGGSQFRSHFSHQSSFGPSPFLRGIGDPNNLGIPGGPGWQPEIENEEEVAERKDEYLEHPLFKTLKIYDDELRDYVTEKLNKLQMNRKPDLPMFGYHGPSDTHTIHSGVHHTGGLTPLVLPPSALSSSTPIVPMPVNIFAT